MSDSPCRAVLLFAGFLLSGCTTAVPMHVERAGTLPAARYDQFAQASASLPPVKVAAQEGSFPEPVWVYAFDAPFDPRAAPLQIGRFSGKGEVGERVAGNLPAQLVRVLGATALFPSVTTEATVHGYVLSGTITRAGDQDVFESDAATQVEATVTRDGVALGAMQINAVQVGIMPLSPLTILVSAAMSAGQGTRSSFVSERFAQIFRSVADGVLTKAKAGGTVNRYMLTPGAAH